MRSPKVDLVHPSHSVSPLRLPYTESWQSSGVQERKGASQHDNNRERKQLGCDLAPRLTLEEHLLSPAFSLSLSRHGSDIIKHAQFGTAGIAEDEEGSKGTRLITGLQSPRPSRPSRALKLLREGCVSKAEDPSFMGLVKSQLLSPD
ncbi:UNVERIFIED_CONTAM: hypothetical protein K2H54_004186 [Gekko kuhli]